MKKNIFRLLLLAGVVIMFTACDKDDNNLPEEAGVNNPLLRTDWLDHGLYGKVKQTTIYSFDRVEWDTLASKPVAQQKYIRDKSIVDYNSVGYVVNDEYFSNVITNAYSDGMNVVVLENLVLTSDKNTYEYDGKNRWIKMEGVSYSYLASVAGNEIYSTGYAGDTLTYQPIYNTDPFSLEVDTTFSKTEVAYDDNAKLATMLDYELQADGTWEEVGKTTYTLNSEGYIDDNSTRTEYRVKTNSVDYEVSQISYNKNDAQGNWIENYYYVNYGPGQDNVHNYQTRDITYY
jgi:hypothetical protein